MTLTLSICLCAFKIPASATDQVINEMKLFDYVPIVMTDTPDIQSLPIVFHSVHISFPFLRNTSAHI